MQYQDSQLDLQDSLLACPKCGTIMLEVWLARKPSGIDVTRRKLLQVHCTKRECGYSLKNS